MDSDLISRDQLLGDLYAEWLLCTPDTPIFINGELQRCEKAKLIEEGMKLVQNQPAVNAAEVVHGEWLSAYEYALKIGVTDEERLEEAKKDKLWKFCNNCEQQVKGVRNYCPNCGAKMDGGDKE